VLLVALLLISAPAKTVKMAESGAARVGGMAPAFAGWDLTGQRMLTLAGLLRAPGVAALLVSFARSDCRPCADALPRLWSVAQRHREVQLLLVDVEADREKAQQFAGSMKLEGPALLDKFEQAAKAYGAEQKEMPRTFLIDGNGRVRAIYGLDADDFEKVVEEDLEAARIPLRQ